MKNVIIFAVEGARFAVELRWVREVITMGHVTPVPGAPLHLVGAINVRGAITPLLDLGVLMRRAALAGEALPMARDEPEHNRGESAVLLDVHGTALALRMVKVDEVVTADACQLPDGARPAGVTQGAVLDSAGQAVALIEPESLVNMTLSEAQELAAVHPAERRDVASAGGDHGPG